MKGTRSRCALLFLFLACIVGPSPTLANWPMFQHNVTHSGATQQDGAESDSTAWEYDTTPDGWNGDVIWASPVINSTATRVYVGTRAGRMFCFDLADGDTIWTRSVADALTSTPALCGNYLYVLGDSDDRRLHCLNATNGNSVWVTDTLGSVWWTPGGDSQWMESSPIVVDGHVYVGARDGRVYSISTGDGDIDWSSSELGQYIVSSPVYAGGRLFVGATGWTSSTECRIWCLDASDGDSLWSYFDIRGNAGGTMSSPAVDAEGAYVYVGMNARRQWSSWANGGNLFCFHTDAERYAPVEPSWRFYIQCDVRGTPLIVQDSVYVTSGRGLYVFDRATGHARAGMDSTGGEMLDGNQETWSSIAMSKRWTIAEQETLLFVGDGGVDSGEGVYGLDKDLNILWHYPTYCPVWGSPAIAAGKVVVGANNGMVLCFVDEAENGRVVTPHGEIVYGGGSAAVGDVVWGAGCSGTSWIQPNPARRDERVRLRLPPVTAGCRRVAILDVAGRVVRELTVPELGKPGQALEWDGRTDSGVRATAGVYLCRVRGDHSVRAGSVILLP